MCAGRWCPGDASPVYEEASPVVKVMGGLFHHHHFWGDLSAWGVYKMGIVRYLSSSTRANKTTHNTQQTHNDKMSRRHPTLKRLCPLSPWQQPRQHRLLVPPLPMDPRQAQGAWLMLVMLAGSHLGHQNKPHQKIERIWCIGLKWPLFISNKQQSTRSWRPR
jgi:hypothetical protein